jgi:rubrerythrin
MVEHGAHDPAEGLTSLEALGIAIRAEMDAGELFDELARSSDDPLIRRRYELLAAVENQHREYLTARYRELAGDVALKLPPSRVPASSGGAARHPEQVLDAAIDEERHAREFYLQAARDTEDLSGRTMFRFLADMHYQHWMTLAQEKDLLVRYPNYGRPGKVPWHAEKSLRSGR